METFVRRFAYVMLGFLAGGWAATSLESEVIVQLREQAVDCRVSLIRSSENTEKCLHVMRILQPDVLRTPPTKWRWPKQCVKCGSIDADRTPGDAP